MNNERYTFIAEEEMIGMRVDMALSLFMEEASRSGMQKLLEKGSVRINGEICTLKKRKLNNGDVVEVWVPQPEVCAVVPENIPIEIIYEDEDLLIINKEKNMVVHPAAGNESNTLVNAILYHCKDLSSINGVVRPGIVHRIDKDTTGLLMVAKNDKTHISLAEQLAQHTVERRYQAIVYNNFTQDEGTVHQSIGRDPKNRFKRAVTSLNAKDAVTHYKVLERAGKFTLLELKLETGRTHQIRVHMAYINHPLLGDLLYGPKKSAFGINTQMLHAKTLGFIHPRTGVYMEFDSPLPEEFLKNWERVKK